MSEPQPPQRDEPAGIFCAALAYAIWGVVPIYWHQIAYISAFEITAHRVLWCALLLGAVALLRGRLGGFPPILRNASLMRLLLLSAALISVNWTVYVYAATSNQLVAASLGYYITPLVSIVLGIVTFGESLSRLRLAAIGLAVAGVAVQAVEVGRVPWVSLTLAFSFGFYGYVRKRAPIGAIDALTVETWLLLPLVLGFLAFLSLEGRASFPGAGVIPDLFLIGAGPITAIPLVLFGAGVRRIRLSTLGFLQYLGPTITLAIGVSMYHEPFTIADAITFGCVWAALLLVAADARFNRRAAAMPDLPPE